MDGPAETSLEQVAGQAAEAATDGDASRIRRGPVPRQPCPSLPDAATPEPEATAEFAYIDAQMRGWFLRLTQGAPLLAGLAAAHDWSVHLAQSPGRRTDLALKAMLDAGELARYALHRALGEAGEPPHDARETGRFRHELWRQYPFDVWAQSWLAARDWWQEATAHTRGLNAWSSQQTAFWAESVLAGLCPANFPWLNPEIMARTVEERGENLVRGAHRLADFMRRTAADRRPHPPEGFRVGETLAATPGEVILETELIELIQYTPVTPTVHPVPLLIVPAWIMKYYILDLSAHNSLARWLVGQGFTVFMISWKNPDAGEAGCGMQSYLDRGVGAAIDAVQAVTGSDTVHAAGYCLGGTLLSIEAARMARDGDDRLASLTLLAAQTDFSEPGEVSLLVDEAQVTFLEDMMSQTGVMPGRFMGAGFKALRPDEQIWEPMVREYWLGETPPVFDMLVWNADTTRMPLRMMREYLRGLYLENRLSQGRFAVDGAPVALADIGVPVFALGTLSDHVAPWKSVFKITRFVDTEVTFVLTSGGHNAGIVSEPGHKGREYRMAVDRPGQRFVSPEAFLARASVHEGSWWEAWRDWLVAHMDGPRVRPPPMGRAEAGYAPIRPAPGRYIREL